MPYFKIMQHLFFCTFFIISGNTLAEVFLPTANGGFSLLDKEQQLIEVKAVTFKKGWKWIGSLHEKPEKKSHNTRFLLSQDNKKLRWTIDAEAKPKEITLNTEMISRSRLQLEYAALVFKPSSYYSGGKLVIHFSNGKTISDSLPPKNKIYHSVTQFDFISSNNKKTTIRLEKAASIHTHKEIRVQLISDTAQGEKPYTNKFSISTSHKNSILLSSSELKLTTNSSTWFPFNPDNKTGPSVIDMSDWLKIPDEALSLHNDKIIDNHSQRYIAWGSNTEVSNGVAPTRDIATQRAQWFSKWGVNSIRLHKFTNSNWAGIGSSNHADEYSPVQLDKFDFYLNELRNNGVTYAFSPIFKLQLQPQDQQRVLAYQEIQAINKKIETTALVWFAEDIQKIHINSLTNILNHKNPYSGLRYADDPALAYLEIQNEENIFWGTTLTIVKKLPSYKKLLAAQFSEWLLIKYTSHDNLVASWGKEAINTFHREGGYANENLNSKNIFPIGNPWFWDNQGKQHFRAKRLQDTAEFLLEKQNTYYQKAINAIRDTGFKAPIITSNWQAGTSSAHFLNLYSDAKYGMIDRHNYIGGAQGKPRHEARSGQRYVNASGLFDAGGGLLSTGMQQVKNRPFVFSEWATVVPTQWAAADTVIIAAYGMGLQGWDMSYSFASNGNGFTPTLQFPKNKKYNNLSPVVLGLNPVLSRMVLRGDIAQGPDIAQRRLTKNQAITQQYDFLNTSSQNGDLKSFSGTPHHSALAKGRIVIDFKNNEQPSVILDSARKTQTDNITSLTGELNWSTLKGYEHISINTAGTQGISGFSHNINHQFIDLTLTPKTRFSTVLITAKNQNKIISLDKDLIIVAVARAYNSGMKLSADIIIDMGRSPIILEPVQADINFKRKKGVVHILDHDGRDTGKYIPFTNGNFALDTGRDKTLYYWVEFND